MALVAQALDSVADEADDRGDGQSAANATYLAGALRGCDNAATSEMIRAAELLLEQGITYVACVSERYEKAAPVSNVVAH